MTHFTHAERWSLLATFGFMLVVGIIPSPYMPHAVCWRGDVPLIASVFGFNVAIFAAYMTIGTMLLLVNWRLKIQTVGFLVFGFGAFIWSCGLTHLLSAVTLWWPLYWMQVGTDAVCAATSVATAIYLLSNRKALFAVATYMRRHWREIQTRSLAELDE